MFREAHHSVLLAGMMGKVMHKVGDMTHNDSLKAKGEQKMQQDMSSGGNNDNY